MRRVLVTACVLAVSLAACGKKEDSGKPVVAVAPGGVTVKGNDGTATITTGGGAAVAAAANLPDYAPLYPGASVEMSAASAPGDESSVGGTVTYMTNATPQQVVDFYKQKSAAKGVPAKMNANMGAALMFAAADDSGARSVQVIATPAGTGTNVAVTWASQK